MRGDARYVCETLVAETPGCVASVHVVDTDGYLLVSVPASFDPNHGPEVSRLGRQVAHLFRPRPCMRSSIDERMSCIAMDTGNNEALVVVFNDEPDVAARLPRMMARAVAHLRTRSRQVPPSNGGTGGTPNEARAFVSVRDLDHDA